MNYCIGNGQAHQWELQAKVGALNCMHDQQAILQNGGGGLANGTTEVDKVLCILWQTYGEKTVIEWGTDVLDTLQQAEVLRQGMHEICISGKAKEGYKLDDSALPCPELVAEWIMRDVRKQQERGCSSQGRQSAEQQSGQPSEIMPELPYQSPQGCKVLFDMWSKGEFIGLLQQTLYTIQKIRRSADGKREEGSIMNKTIVRRLTPLECTRLQGFPDGWVDIGEPDEKGDYYYTDSTGKRRKVTDSAKYKALGNSIATPFWRYLARRIVAQYEHEVTMGSLFSGIGGFEYVFQQCGCKPVWASEIEEFPIAVTKEHFPEE